MEAGKLFNILDSIDSTNNYAMAQVHAGLAQTGMAWFALEQWAGKGQRGRHWQSKPGENILMSVVFAPDPSQKAFPFLFSIRVALVVRDLVAKYLPGSVTIKWPNDIYFNDRKAGGILIENTYQGTNWTWAIVGIGININQTAFPKDLPNPVSVKKITNQDYDVLSLARELHQNLLTALSNPSENADLLLETYNSQLYARGKKVKLKKQNQVFETEIIGVDLQGKLLTKDILEREFSVGEVEMLNHEPEPGNTAC